MNLAFEFLGINFVYLCRAWQDTSKKEEVRIEENSSFKAKAGE
jgi:hypothetical protein